MRSVSRPVEKAKLSSLQRYAIWELLAQAERVDHVSPTTWRALERRGYITGAAVTPAGLAALGLPLRRPRTVKTAIRAACLALPWGDGTLQPAFGSARASVTVDDPDDDGGYLSPGSHPDCLGTIDMDAELDWEDEHPRCCADNVWSGVTAWLESHGYAVTTDTHHPRSTRVRWIHQDSDASRSPAENDAFHQAAIEHVRRKHV